ncbi:Shy1 protein [Starmerella bacillaris]|uniref:SURF1-like protein n=1 Tax=Starmerella bacillaris TaxID=1247836 RepID=A0AAV5RCD0_STABA|nr:Shy1 protein [Starmerella bacillaris]
MSLCGKLFTASRSFRISPGIGARSYLTLSRLNSVAKQTSVPFGARGVVLKSNWDESKSRTKPKSNVKNKLILGLLILMPIVSFGLGTWQVRRLQWKVGLIQRAEGNLRKEPVELPVILDAETSNEWDYVRIKVNGIFDHSKESLIGPRMNHGRRGYLVVTPLVRPNASTVLIVRGWIDDAHKLQSTRPESLLRGQQQVECLIREKPQKNSFTPERNQNGDYHFMDIDQIAKETQSEAVMLEAVISPEDAEMPERLRKRGIPVGVVPNVNYRNAHFQYILTWYGICLFSVVMLLTMYKQRRPVDPLQQKLKHARKWQ